MAKDDFLSVIVPLVVVFEAAAFTRIGNGPTGKAARHFSDIFLRIAAIHAQGVQFQKLAAIIFIQSTLAGFAVRMEVVLFLRNRLPVIQIEKYGRAFGRFEKHVVKLAEYPRPDSVPLKGRNGVVIGAFIQKNIEVIEPEIGKKLLQLMSTVDGAKQLGFA